MSGPLRVSFFSYIPHQLLYSITQGTKATRKGPPVLPYSTPGSTPVGSLAHREEETKGTRKELCVLPYSTPASTSIKHTHNPPPILVPVPACADSLPGSPPTSGEDLSMYSARAGGWRCTPAKGSHQLRLPSR